ncbi:MAG: DUF6452 family protein [Flavobacteriaceae bacterium]
MLAKRYCFLISFFLFLGCEKDDVCLEGTPGTPRLIIRLMDHDNPNNFKPAQGYAQEVNSSRPYVYFNSDSIVLALDSAKPSTIYAFVFENLIANDTIRDTLAFNYGNRKDIYINRACGIIAEWTLSTPPVEAVNVSRWYKNASILNDTLRNENQAHLAIYH